MTIDEASERYQIPIEVLKEYESWGLCGAVRKVVGAWQYDEEDLKRLSLIMTLHDVGFEPEEVEEYMRLALEGDKSRDERLRLLDKRRGAALDEIHLKERKLERQDYLRYMMQKY